MVTERIAIAKGTVKMKSATLKLIEKGEAAKGEVLALAQTAGIMAAKKTSELIPLCHPLRITNVAVEFKLNDENSFRPAFIFNIHSFGDSHPVDSCPRFPAYNF